MKLSPATRFRAKGDTLIEVLVAILVLSFGLLALVALLTNSLKLSATSNYRTVAAEQATAMADFMRANPLMLASYFGASGPASAIDETCFTTAGCPASYDSATGVTSSALVGMHVALWKERLAALLPTGTGVICQDSIAGTRAANVSTCDGAGTGTIVVKVCWDESARIAVSGRDASGGALASTKTCTWTNI